VKCSVPHRILFSTPFNPFHHNHRFFGKPSSHARFRKKLLG
jgi:hypothetical protein